MSDSLQPHGLQHTWLPCPPVSSRVCSQSCPSSQWCHPIISSSVIPSPLAFNLSQHQGLFQWVSSSHQVAKELKLQPQHQSFQFIFRVDILEDWLVWSPCSPRNSQEASPAPQFKSINSSVLSFLCGPTLINSSAVTKSGFPNSTVGKESTCNAGDPCSIPGLGRSLGEGKGYPLQYSGLENSMDCIVHGVAKSQTWLSDFHFQMLIKVSLICQPHTRGSYIALALQGP